MNSCNTDIFFSNYYHLQSVRFELAEKDLPHFPCWDSTKLIKTKKQKKKPEQLPVSFFAFDLNYFKDL